jgi:hypothetical protein
MGRGEYGRFNVGQDAAATMPPPQLPLENVTKLSPPADPWALSQTDLGPIPPQRQPWTEEQKRDFQRVLGLSSIGSVAGAVLWKDHRIWGFILGGMAGGGLAKVIFAPTAPEGPW